MVYNPTLGPGFITGTKTLLLKDNSGTVLDSITLLDVTDGLGGGSFVASNLKTNRNTSVTPNTFSPTTLTAQASFFDTSGTEKTQTVQITPSFSGGVDKMQVSSPSGNTNDITITADDGDGGTITLAGAAVATKDVVLTAVFTDPSTGQTTTITETFYIVSDGVDGIDAITVINTNQAHSLPASSAGVVSSYTNSGTNIRVFEGTTELSYDGTGTSDGTWTVSTSQSPSSTITIGSVTDNGDDIDIDDHSLMDNNEDTVTITYNISGTRSGGASFTATTTQTLTKVKDGTDGVNGAAAGIVYAGDWKLTKNDGSTVESNNRVVYLGEDDLQYVVKYGGSFYNCAVTHRYAGIYDGGDDYLEDDVVGVITAGPTTTYYKAAQEIISGEYYPGDPEWPAVGFSIAPGTTQTGGNFWESFGAEFTSVATDILFAEDVYANRTINIGTGENNKPVISLNADTENDNASPYISIGQVTQSFEEEGIFLGYPSESYSPVMSMVSGSDYLIYNDGVLLLSNASISGTGSNSTIQGPGLQIGYKPETQYNRSDNRSYNFTVNTDGIVSASEAFIQGTIDASAGNIGQWVITPPDEDTNGAYINGTGGVLKDSDGEIRFDPNEAEIQIYSASYDDTSIDFPLTSSVTAANGRFYIDYGDGAELAPILHLERSTYNASPAGKVQNEGYYFDLSDSSMATHEFSFSMRVDGLGTYGTRYNKSTSFSTSETGQDFLIITSSAAPGSAGAYIQITPSASMAAPWAGGNKLIGDPSSMEFHYYCENHAGMGNRTYIYNEGLALERVPDYVERITIGSQDSFTSTDGGSGNFSFSGQSSYYNVLTGITSTTQYGSLETAQADLYSAFSSTTNLDAGPVTLTDIQHKSSHVTTGQGGSAIASAEFTSETPTYFPSTAGQVHGGNQISFLNMNGHRQIYQYIELWNHDDNELIATKALSSVGTYGETEASHIWVAQSSGGGINSVVGTTAITLEDGTTKLAKDITLNDKILAWDDDTNMWVSARISKIKKSNVSELYKMSIDGNEIEVSDSHKFWLFGNQKNSGQISSEELYKHKLAGNPMTQNSLKLWVKDGDSKKKVAITNIRKIEKEEEVITFTVPNYVNYISNNIISHNAAGQLTWTQQSMGYGSSDMGARTQSSGVSSWPVEIPTAGNYKLRYRIMLRSRAATSVTIGRSSSATVTVSYDAHNFTFDSDSSSQIGYLNSGYSFTYGTINVQKNNNFIEILPAGIQVVSGTGRFTRLHRRNQDSVVPELLEVIDGSVKIESRNSVDPADSSTLGLTVDGDLMPTTTAKWDFGSSTKYWENGYFVNLNGGYFDTSIRQMVAGGVFTGSTNGQSPGVSNSFNISSVTRTAEGVYTVTLSNTTPFTAGYGYVIAQGYGVSGDSPSQTPGDNEFVITWGTKVNGTVINISSGDNDTNSRRDFYKCYFTFWSR